MSLLKRLSNRSAGNVVAQLLALATGILACCIILGFVFPQAPRQMSAPFASLAQRFPLWSWFLDQPLFQAQTPSSAVALGIGAVLLFTACYLLALWITRQVKASRLLFAVVLGGMCLFGLASVLSLPNTGSDIYLYMMYAREFTVHHASPFTAMPASFPSDPYLAYVPSPWVYTPSLYGPIWTALSILSGFLAGGDIVRDLLSLRLILFAISVGSALLIWKILGRLNPTYRLTGLIFFAWNPIVLLQGQQHVEPVIIFFLLLSVALYQSQRKVAAFFAAALSTVTKLVSAPLFVIYIFFMARGRRPKYAWVGLVLVAGLALLLLPGNLYTLRRLLLLPVFTTVLLWAIGQVWGVGEPDGIAQGRESAANLPRLLIGWSVALFAFNLLLGSTQYSWYLIPLVGVAALVADSRIALPVIVLASSGLLNYSLADIPASYVDLPVNLFRVIWWVPVLVALAWTFRSYMITTISTARSALRDRTAWAQQAQAGGHHPQLVWLLRGLVALGLAAIIYYLSWWFSSGTIIQSPFLVVALLLAAVYDWVQLAGNWALYLTARRRSEPPPVPEGLTVDVYVTCCKEDHALIERALSAACRMRGPHKTYLLDDGDDPALKVMAQRLGAGYLTRVGSKDAKAGNMNAALPRTSGDIIVIFDIDHAPEPAFLERSLGYFSDPKVGFVQVMLTFCNGKESWVARAAGESTLDYYNPTSVGMDGIGSATLVGSNALIRRKALESIGGYQPGLAEDLATSIAIHASGWQSVYVAEPLAPGLSPPDVAAWFTQQLKWARGVFDLLLTAYPRYFAHLTWGQRLSYAVRMTYYWIGAVVTVHVVFLLALLFSGGHVAHIGWEQYIIHMLPLACVTMLIRQVALLAWRHPSTPNSLLWRAVCLVYATWPVYMLAWIMAVLQVPLAFRATPKRADGGVKPAWLVPQVASLVLLAGGVVYTIFLDNEVTSIIPVLFAAAQCVPLAIFLWFALKGRGRRGTEPARTPGGLAPIDVKVRTLAPVEMPAARDKAMGR